MPCYFTTGGTSFRSSLQGRLIIGCLVLLGLSFVMAGFLLYLIGNDYRQAKINHENLRVYKNVLWAANAISAERGPTNTLLGGGYAPSSEARQRLATFRANSDNKVAVVLDDYARIKGRAEQTTLGHITDTLEQARNIVDSKLSIPFSSRTPSAIMEAVDGMFSAVNAINPLINSAALRTLEGEGDIADEALIGQKLFEIRDYAGRMGSIITPYIATRQPIAKGDQAKLQQIYGRIVQLWELAKPYLSRFPSLSKDIQDVESIFFVKGVGILSALQEEGETGMFTYTTRTMTDAIVPTFAPLEAIRTSYLELMTDKAERKLNTSFNWFLSVSVALVFGMVVDVALMLWANFFIFRPLLRARYNIVALAEDRPIILPARSDKISTEIDEVFNALGVLRTRLTERQAITASLRTHALTDGLTGLLNRRAFDQVGEGKIFHTELPAKVGLILLDIDYFKSVNDRYGHSAGDEVLKSVAKTIQAHVRNGDLAARQGGEEFAVILGLVTMEQLVFTAEKLRVAISSQAVEISPKIELNVTASFGISTGVRGDGSWKKLYNEADAALYEAKRSGRNCVRTAK